MFTLSDKDTLKMVASVAFRVRRICPWVQRDEVYSAVLLATGEAIIRCDPARSTNPKAWCARMAFQGAVDELRSGRFIRRLAELPTYHQCGTLDRMASAPEPDTAHFNELIGLCSDGLRRDVLRMKFEQRMTRREIRKKIGCSNDQYVSYLIASGLKEIRGCM
jgi:DNA-directed RNA polymerase specialized sigma24 family protein